MAYNFPDAPTLGQVFGNYVWDGEKWKVGANVSEAPLGNLVYGRANNAGAGEWRRAVEVAGDTMTGLLTGTLATFIMPAASPSGYAIQGSSSGSPSAQGAIVGTNGTQYTILGAPAGLAFKATGPAEVTGTLIVGTPSLSTHAATKQYVDDRFLSASAAITFASLSASGGTSDQTITVTGAASGDAVALSIPVAMNVGVTVFALITTANTVVVRAVNSTTGTVSPTAKTIRATVIKL